MPHADSAYTERYMGLPHFTHNWAGYKEADLTARTDSLRGKNLFLVHATADKNVHFQQSMILAKRMVESNVTFRQQVG